MPTTRANVNAYDAVQAMLAAMPARLQFSGSTQADYCAWRSHLLPAYLASLGPWPESVPLQPELAEETDCGSHRRLRLYYNSSPGVTVPAYLLLPKSLAAGERRPALIACHGHGDGIYNDGKDDLVGLGLDDPDRAASIRSQNLDYAKQAVELGYVVIVPDWLPFGERRAPAEWVREGRDPCNVVCMAWQYLGYTLLAQNIWDGMRAVDILAARPEVDPSRIGVIGLSYGGTMTMHLAINDPRLKVAVISGYISTVRGDAITMRGAANFCGSQHLPGLLRYGDIPDLAGLIAPKPLLAQAGQKDSCFIIEDVRPAVQRLQAIYEAAGCAERLTYDEHPYEHSWHGAQAWPWLERWL